MNQRIFIFKTIAFKSFHRKNATMTVKQNHMTIVLLMVLTAGFGINSTYGEETMSVIAPGAKAEKLADGFGFSEGPTSDTKGNVYFSDYWADRILKWSLDGNLSIVKENLGGPIGLYLDKYGNLLVCTAKEHRIKKIDSGGSVTVFPNKYKGKLFNSPNDIWIDPKGGIYFTDPRFSPLEEKVEQDGFHIYYIVPGSKNIIKAADDLSKPNGIIGSPDGSLVYVTDTPVDKTFVYTVNDDGTLSDKRLFAPEGYDGMAVDSLGNVYITMQKSVEVYNSSGEKIETIMVPDKPTNVCFGGKDKRTLFITARISLYSIRMRIKGL